MEFVFKGGSGPSGDMTVPECMIEEFLSWCEECEEEMSREELEEWYEEDRSGWASIFDEFLRDRLTEVDGTLVEKEEAEFLKKWHLSNVPMGGGYPKHVSKTFEDDGKKYGMMTFFWSSEGGGKGFDPYLLAYREDR